MDGVRLKLVVARESFVEANHSLGLEVRDRPYKFQREFALKADDERAVRYREIVTVAAAVDADGRAGIERLAKRAAAAAAAEERPLEQRPVADVDGRDLLRIAAKRFARKVRR